MRILKFPFYTNRVWWMLEVEEFYVVISEFLILCLLTMLQKPTLFWWFVSEQWSSLFLKAKPEKQWTAFSIELRGVNFWSARLCETCVEASGRCSASGKVRKVLRSHRIGLLLFWASLVAATNCSVILRSH